MLNPLPVKTSVGFRGVDWELEQQKSEQRVERRKNKEQHRAQRKTHRKMSNEQLKTFLQFVVSPEETTKGNTISLMDGCVFFLKTVEKAGIVTFPGGSSNVEKVKLSLEKFEDMKAKPTLLHLIQSWMHAADEEGFYSVQPLPSSPSSDGRGSSVSGLTEGTFETISLSSHQIDDAVAAEIIEAGVFAAYAAGKKRGHAHKRLCTDFSNIFRTEKSEYIDSMAAAKNEDWPKSDDGSGEGEASVGSYSSKSCIDDLACEAHTAVAKKADELGLTTNQIQKLNEYCFIPLQRD